SPARFGVLPDDTLITRGLWQYAHYYDPAPAAVVSTHRPRHCWRLPNLQVKTTARGHITCASVRTRSARPISPTLVISSAPNHTSRQTNVPAAAAQTAGRSPNGTVGPRLQLPAGQLVRAMKPIAAQKACISEPPPAGSGLAATS